MSVQCPKMSSSRAFFCPSASLPPAGSLWKPYLRAEHPWGKVGREGAYAQDLWDSKTRSSCAAWLSAACQQRT